MRKRDWKAYILLDDAGMLSARPKKALEKALAGNPELRAFQNQLQWVRNATKSSDDETAVSEFAVERIQAEARQALRTHHPGQRYGLQRTVFAQWRPALIYASISVLLILVGAMLLVHHSHDRLETYAESPALEEPILVEEWDWLFEEELLELAEHLDRLDMELREMAWITDDNHTEEWARELLQLEGS